MPSSAPPAANERNGSPWLTRLKRGLTATREKLGRQLAQTFSRSPKLDAQTLEELENILLSADVGVAATQRLMESLQRSAKDTSRNPSEVLREALAELLASLEQPFAVGSARPYVIMLAGVNGAGKTTSIGKLAKHLREQGLSVLLAAGDTFRAAAEEQLQEWGRRNDVTVIAQQGGDPAAVMFDAIAAARARGIDVVLADTAGRLATQAHLMEELRKVKRVIAKAQPNAPHEILLVLDANTGQNGIAQVRAFDAALGLTGLIVTKLDGTAKGGMLAAIAQEKPIPLRFIGVGEGIDDLRPFRAGEFAEALFET